MHFIAHAALARHRPGGAPDRSSLDRCVRLGVDMVEVDVRTCADALVLRHDAALTSGRPVSAVTVDELRALDPSVLTLDEAAVHLGGRLPLLLDLKGAALVAPLGRWLGQRADPEAFAVCTDDAAALSELRRAASRVARWRTIPEVRGGPGEGRRRIAAAARRHRLVTALAPLAGEVGAVGLCVDHWAVTGALCAQAHRLDLAVAAWTVNRPHRALTMSRCGVDWITSDEVSLVRATLDGKDSRAFGRDR